jgi:hypothetical protein
MIEATAIFPDFSSIARILPFPFACGVVVADAVTAPVVTNTTNNHGGGVSDDDGNDGDVEPVTTRTVRLPPRFLVTHDQQLHLYSLGSVDYDESVQRLRAGTLHCREGDALPLEQGHQHLLDINVNGTRQVARGDDVVWLPGGGLNLISASMSPDARWLACSDPLQVKLYRVHQRSQRIADIEVVKVHVQHLLAPASTMTFSAVSDARKRTRTHTHIGALLHTHTHRAC